MADYKVISPERKRKNQYISFGFLYAIIVFYFLINGEGIFGWSSAETYICLFYIVGVTLFLAVAEKLPKDLCKPAVQSIFGFLIFIPITIIVFMALADLGLLPSGQSLPAYLLLPTLVFQLVVVASSEEIIFRGAILRYLQDRTSIYVAFIGSSVLFGFFHWAVYEGTIGSVFFAIMMGLLFAVLATKINLGAAVAVHGIFNFGVLGGLNI